MGSYKEIGIFPTQKEMKEINVATRKVTVIWGDVISFLYTSILMVLYKMEQRSEVI